MPTFCRQASPADLIALVQFSTGSKCYSKNSTELKNVGRFVQLRPFQNVVVFVVLSDNRISDPLTVMLIPISTACDLRFHMPCYDPARMTRQETVAPLRIAFFQRSKSTLVSLNRLNNVLNVFRKKLSLGAPFATTTPKLPGIVRKLQKYPRNLKDLPQTQGTDSQGNYPSLRLAHNDPLFKSNK